MSEHGAGAIREVTNRLSGALRAVASLLQEKRRHRRIAIPLVVKMLLEDGTEEEAIVRDISAGGAALLSESHPAPGTKIIIYIQGVGRMESTVVRDHPHGFAVDFNCSRTKRERVADKLTWIVNKARLGLSEEGLSLGGVKGQEADLVLSTGISLPCRIVELSLNGASVQIAPRPAIGAEVTLGRMRGTVTHHLPEGVDIEFTRPGATTAAQV